MFKRRPMGSRLLDKLHKGFVVTCLGLTGYGCYLLGSRIYEYYTVLRPVIKARGEEEVTKLLSEGKASADPSTLRDSATDLKA